MNGNKNDIIRNVIKKFKLTIYNRPITDKIIEKTQFY